MKRKLMMVAVAGALGVVSLATASFSVAGTLGASVLTDNGKALTGYVIAAPASLQQAYTLNATGTRVDSAVNAAAYNFGQISSMANTSLSNAAVLGTKAPGTTYASTINAIGDEVVLRN